MKHPTIEIEIPQSLADYFQDSLSVIRYQQGAGPCGPSLSSSADFNPYQCKFLADIAHAFHNLASEDGVAFFYAQAVKINAAWTGHEAELFNGSTNAHFFKKLWPLPVNS